MLLKDFSLSLLLLKNDSIIDSNATEGIRSLPPVESMVTAYHAESKVTACHAMRGTRSSRDNIREGDTILEVAVDDDKDLYAKCHTWGDIIDSNITDGIPSLNPVESMSWLTTPSPRSWLATPCMGPAALRTTLGRETRDLK
jgi:hypothetical protein